METVNAIKKGLINTFRVEGDYCVELNSLSLTTCPMRPWKASIYRIVRNFRGTYISWIGL